MSYKGDGDMRFIYLSTTQEKNVFGTMDKTIDYFKEFLTNNSKRFNFNFICLADMLFSL